MKAKKSEELVAGVRIDGARRVDLNSQRARREAARAAAVNAPPVEDDRVARRAECVGDVVAHRGIQECASSLLELGDSSAK